MKLFEILRRINFKVGSLDDITGRAINNIIETRYVIDELNTCLFQYANKTKGIVDTYSTQLDLETPFIPAPKNALRSESYLFGQLIVNGRIFPLDIRGKNDSLNNFTVSPFQGITSWIMPWSMGKQNFLTALPTNSTDAKTTKVVGKVNLTDTEIEVESTDGFIRTFGRLQIGSEKILYQYCDNKKFYGCVRGIEGTVAQNFQDGQEVKHCNLILYYAKLPQKIVVYDDNFVSQETLNIEIEVCEEHLEGIIKLVAYNLLMKLDNERAGQYKVDSEVLFEQYEADIRKGYSNLRKGANVRDPYFAQSGVPMYTNLTM